MFVNIVSKYCLFIS